jgi:hypothetical protein
VLKIKTAPPSPKVWFLRAPLRAGCSEVVESDSVGDEMDGVVCHDQEPD